MSDDKKQPKKKIEKEIGHITLPDKPSRDDRINPDDSNSRDSRPKDQKENK